MTRQNIGLFLGLFINRGEIFLSVICSLGVFSKGLGVSEEIICEYGNACIYHRNHRNGGFCLIWCYGRHPQKNGYFGVIVMAAMTAVGGGIIRDLVLGIHPPNTFKDPDLCRIFSSDSCHTFCDFLYQETDAGQQAMFLLARE